jgi:hypothetical protein
MNYTEHALYSSLIFVSLLSSCCVLWIVIVANAPKRKDPPWRLCGYHLACYEGEYQTCLVDSAYCEACKDFESLGRKKSRKLKLVK